MGNIMAKNYNNNGRTDWYDDINKDWSQTYAGTSDRIVYKDTVDSDKYYTEAKASKPYVPYPSKPLYSGASTVYDYSSTDYSTTVSTSTYGVGGAYNNAVYDEDHKKQLLKELFNASIKLDLPKVNPEDVIKLALDELTKSLKTIGWEIQINPAIAYGDRKGYQIMILEPKKEEENVQSGKEE